MNCADRETRRVDDVDRRTAGAEAEQRAAMTIGRGMERRFQCPADGERIAFAGGEILDLQQPVAVVESVGVASGPTGHVQRPASRHESVPARRRAHHVISGTAVHRA